jgi:hypothetical protein
VPLRSPGGEHGFASTRCREAAHGSLRHCGEFAQRAKLIGLWESGLAPRASQLIAAGLMMAVGAWLHLSSTSTLTNQWSTRIHFDTVGERDEAVAVSYDKAMI